MALSAAKAIRRGMLAAGRPSPVATRGLSWLGSADRRSAHSAAASSHYRVLVVGAGAGGLSVASSFAKSIPGEVAVVDPSDTHWYQPLWTLVGGGVKPLSESRKSLRKIIPEGASLIKGAFASADPVANKVTLADGRSISYDFLVMAAGIDIKWDAIPGLRDALEANNGVSSNYSPLSVENTWKNIRSLKSGKAIFTFPATPIKCAGAPQKIMYLADDYWRTNGVRDNVQVDFVSAVGKLFGVDKYSQRLSAICDERSLSRTFLHNLVAVDHHKKQATFAKMVDGKASDERVVRDFDMLHVAPPMGPLDALAKSPLANAAGWIDVDQHTLQHTKFPNVFGIGDCTSVPTSKTAAAVAGQTGVLKANLRAAMSGLELAAKYDGYTSCPLVTGRNSLMLAEFNGFNATPMETFPYDQGNPTSFAFWLKSEVMPFMYWEMLLKDQWNGVSAYRSLMSPFKDPSHNTNPTA